MTLHDRPAQSGLDVISPRSETDLQRAATTYSIIRERSRPRGLASYEGPFDPSNDVRWQRLWLALQRAKWRTLALVPAAPSVSAFEVARALAWVGRQHLDRPVDVLDASQTELSGLEGMLGELRRRRDDEWLTVVSVAPVADSPVGLAIAQLVDATVLVVRLGDRIVDAQRTIDDLGVETCLGSVLVYPTEAGVP